jgi:hypothetical protein
MEVKLGLLFEEGTQILNDFIEVLIIFEHKKK